MDRDTSNLSLLSSLSLSLSFLSSSLRFLNVNKNMSQRSSPRTPSTTINFILAINPRHLKPINTFLIAIVPVQFTDLVLAMKQVHPAFAAAAAAGADLADAVGGDGEGVDVGFGEGEEFVGGGVEGSPCLTLLIWVMIGEGKGDGDALI